MLEKLDSEVVVRPGWLEAWHCVCGNERFLVVTRSVLVKQTSEMFAPVAKLILECEQAEIVFDEVIEMPSMMFGKAQILVMSLERGIE